MQLYAVNRAAADIGLSQGMALADARAMVPDLAFQTANPAADFRALQGLARWCGRYTPWVNTDGTDGLILDITGCAHLFGGEEALLADISERLQGFGLDHRLGVASTRGAAWALARYGEANISVSDVVTPSELIESIGKLSVEGLRLGTEATRTLRRLGLVRIGQVAAIPRAALKRRFASRDLIGAVTLRLDQALGAVGEPVSPLMPAPQFRTRTAFTEPVLEIAAIEYALEGLLSDLCAMFETKGVGARRLSLAAYRTDGSVSAVQIGTSRPSRDKKHFMLLFRERLQSIEAEYGIDLIILNAEDVTPLVRQQLSLAGDAPDDGNIPVSQLVDRLAGRLGARHVQRSVARESHIPERAAQQAPAFLSARGSWAGRRFTPAAQLPVRPFRLFEYPEILDVMAEVPDGPPVAFRWRRMRVRVARAEGPERIAPEWWLTRDGDSERAEDADNATRDYYRLEDAMGRRFWVYRQGLYHEGLYRDIAPDVRPQRAPGWFMHGLFA